MINIESIIKILEEKGKLTFSEIWKIIEKKNNKDFEFNSKIYYLKADLLLSMTKDERLILVTKDRQKKWDLRKNYSLAEIKEINSKVFGDELKDFEENENDFVDEFTKDFDEI